jgi:hypothetical protein
MADLTRILNAAEALRRAFRPLHEVADRAGAVSVAAEARLSEELKKLPVVQGTRGQIKKGAGGVKGGAVVEPPISGPTLKEIGCRRSGRGGKRRLDGSRTDDLTGVVPLSRSLA